MSRHETWTRLDQTGLGTVSLDLEVTDRDTVEVSYDLMVLLLNEHGFAKRPPANYDLGRRDWS